MNKIKKKSIEEMTEREKKKYYERLEWKIRLSIYVIGILFLFIVFGINIK